MNHLGSRTNLLGRPCPKLNPKSPFREELGHLIDKCQGFMAIPRSECSILEDSVLKLSFMQKILLPRLFIKAIYIIQVRPADA